MSAASWQGQRVIVLGLGRFGGGLGAVRWLRRQGAEVLVTDLADRAVLGDAAEQAEQAGATLVLGGHDGVDVAGADLLLVNPAVPLNAPLVRQAEAAGVPLGSEIALVMERWRGPTVGVTGSNGKSTTASLTCAVLNAAGRRAELGGNIGGSLLDVIDEPDVRDRVAVLELSSFMLELLARRGLGPDVAIITNITPNHLDRHGTFAAYRDAKAAVLTRARRAVLFGDDPAVRDAARSFDGEKLWYGRRGDMVVERNGDLVDRRGLRVIASERIPMLGRMNRLDLAAAVLASAAVLCDEVRATRALATALSRWGPPPHRLALVGTWNGVRWIDDSVSTTPESTEASLDAVDGPCVLIAGGHDKGLDPSRLLAGAGRHARVVLTVGEEGPALASALLAQGLAAEHVGSLDRAVRRAAALARPGEAVLLSPGYSSHDQYRDFSARGRHFASLARRLAGGEAVTGGMSETVAEC